MSQKANGCRNRGSSTGNSGIQVRSRYDDEAGWLDGPQVDVNPPGPWRCGFIYDETREAKVWLWPDVGRPANAKPAHAPKGWKWFHADEKDVWNDVEIWQVEISPMVPEPAAVVVQASSPSSNAEAFTSPSIAANSSRCWPVAVWMTTARPFPAL